jgi:hypothetical protein
MEGAMKVIETRQTDTNGDGTRDTTTTKESIFVDGQLLIFTEARSSPSGSQFKTTSYTYDEMGREIAWRQDADMNGDGSITSMRGEKAYDDAGRLQTERTFSPDFDGDGIDGDYITVVEFAYDVDGRITARNEAYFAWGEQGPSDYRHESWTYDATGNVTVYRIDDPNFFNVEVTKFYTYRWDKLQNIKLQDEIRFGDERPRIVESFTYNEDGTLKTSTNWADYSEYGWFQRVDTYYTWGNAYESRKIVYDREGDWNPERIKFVEEWKNADGHVTHILTSHDVDGNGTYDSRDLIARVFDGGVMVSEIVDIGTDGIYEEVYTRTVEADFLVA